MEKRKHSKLLRRPVTAMRVFKIQDVKPIFNTGIRYCKKLQKPETEIEIKGEKIKTGIRYRN